MTSQQDTHSYDLQLFTQFYNYSWHDSLSLSIQLLWWISVPSFTLMGNWRRQKATISLHCSSNQMTSSLNPTSKNSGMSCRNRTYEPLDHDVLLDFGHIWPAGIGSCVLSSFSLQMLVIYQINWLTLRDWTGPVKLFKGDGCEKFFVEQQNLCNGSHFLTRKLRELLDIFVLRTLNGVDWFLDSPWIRESKFATCNFKSSCFNNETTYFFPIIIIYACS